MKHLILHLGQLSSEFDSASFSSCNLENLCKQNALDQIEETLKGIDIKDLFPYRVSSHLTKEIQEHDSIVIFKEGFRWDEVIRLAVYLRLLPFESWISNVPIIICSDKLPNIFNDKDLDGINDIQNPFNIRGIFYKPFFALFGKKQNEEGIVDYGINNFLKTINKDFVVKDITIISENLMNDRHSITNYWGAVKLALNAGYSANEINYTFPPTLYFNYLLKKYSINLESEINKVNFSSFLRSGKVLLIDDNSDKGWKNVLEKIFGDNTIEANSYVYGLAQKDLKGKLELNRNLEKYDIIFLDLFLPEYQGNKPNMQNGLNLLKLIKRSYPHVPVILFTASNKSWTREKVIDYGADGMYVKESPEFAGDENYSKENFKNFNNLLIHTFDKYKVLRPYWYGIQNILNDHTFCSTPEKGISKFKARIQERLRMFYGLLKRGFEQTYFNKEQFLFSDHELAFITLWSILNEISESNYEKTQPNKPIHDSAGNIITNHPGGKPITYNKYHFRWKIINQEDIFVEYDYSPIIDNSGKILTDPSGKFYKLNYEQKSCFVYENDQFILKSEPLKTKINYEITLYLQIAFLIEKKDNLSKSSQKSSLQRNLVKLNEVRNLLYLTHGSGISSGFYNQTEKEKRGNNEIKPDGVIKDLFELISFLLTGNEDKKI